MAVAKAQASEISVEIKAAVEAILAKHGMELTKVQTTYGDVYGFKCEGSPLVKGENGINMESKEAQAYKRFATSYGLPEGLLGKKFTSKGREFAFAGIAPSRSKFPFAAMNLLEGRMYFFTEDIKSKLV